MSVYQEDISKLFKHLLLKYETHITEVNDRGLKLDRMSILEISLLEYLRDNQGVTQQGLMEVVDIKRKKSTSVINKLIRSGLIQKVDNPQDKRSNWMQLTQQGIRYLKAYKDHEANLVAFVLKDMTVNEEKAIVKFLSKINQTDYLK